MSIRSNFYFIFPTSSNHREYVEYHTPYGSTPGDNIKLQNDHTLWWMPSTHNTHRYINQQAGNCCAPSQSITVYHIRSQIITVGQREIDLKPGGKEKLRITEVLATRTDGSKLSPHLILKDEPTVKGKTPAAKSIERDCSSNKDKKAPSCPRVDICCVRRRP